MEPVERVRAVVRLEPLDRPPAAWWGHTYAQEWSAEGLADATVARQRAYGWDLVKLQPRASCFAEAFGSEYRPSGDPATGPVLVRPAVADPDDWARIPAADSGVRAFADQVDALRTVVDELGPSVPVIQTVFSPLTVAGYLAGEDRPRTAAELRGRRRGIEDALARIADGLADFAASSVRAGAAGIFLAVSDFASADLLSVSEYEDLALPHDLRVLASVPHDAWFNVLHLCGPRLNFGLASALETPALSWSVHDPGNPSLEDGRRRSGRAVMGGIDVQTLLEGAPEDVLEQGRSAVSSTGGAGLVLAPGCSAPPAAPEENLRAILRAVAPEP